MASARKRGQSYTGLFRDAQGRQKSAGTFGTEKEAIRAAEHAEALANPPKTTAAYPTAKRGKPTVAGYGVAAINGARLEGTSRESYRLLFGKHIKPALGSRTLAELTPADIRAFARNLESSAMSASTAHLVMSVLRLIVKTASQDGLIVKDVTAGVSVARKGKAEKVIATPAQAAAIEAAFHPHYRLMIKVMFATGARFGEILGIQAGDVCDRPGGGKVIRIRRTIAEYGGTVEVRPYGKTARASRDVPVGKELAAQIIAQGEAHPEGWAFRNHRGACIRRGNFSRLWRLACDAAGVPGMTPHGARHSVASWLANDPSVPLVAVRDMLGHSSLEQTSAYVHHIDDGDDPRLAALARIAA
ncbi:MAG TPA: tyrosine-type recombinase/integrase [Trebonia sp.]|nr:tyrosine-type recombinase/integrase [Trebonia sp.]